MKNNTPCPKSGHSNVSCPSCKIQGGEAIFCGDCNRCPKTGDIICPCCDNMFDDSNVSCPSCENQGEPHTFCADRNRCPHCGDIICPRCGNEFDDYTKNDTPYEDVNGDSPKNDTPYKVVDLTKNVKDKIYASKNRGFAPNVAEPALIGYINGRRIGGAVLTEAGKVILFGLPFVKACKLDDLVAFLGKNAATPVCKAVYTQLIQQEEDNASKQRAIILRSQATLDASLGRVANFKAIFNEACGEPKDPQEPKKEEPKDPQEPKKEEPKDPQKPKKDTIKNTQKLKNEAVQKPKVKSPKLPQKPKKEKPENDTIKDKKLPKNDTTKDTKDDTTKDTKDDTMSCGWDGGPRGSRGKLKAISADPNEFDDSTKKDTPFERWFFSTNHKDN